jgi:hypothetical protein
VPADETIMQMNAKPIPTLNPRINEIRALTTKIVTQGVVGGTSSK